jgi:hypothetical protein
MMPARLLRRKISYSDRYVSISLLYWPHQGCQREGWSPSMTSKTFLPNPSCLHLLHLEADTEIIRIVVTTTADAVTCPQCHQCTDKVHSRYVRRPADLPWMSCAVQLELHVRRFICSNPACQQKIFVKRLPSVADIWREGLGGSICGRGRAQIRQETLPSRSSKQAE